MIHLPMRPRWQRTIPLVLLAVAGCAPPGPSDQQYALEEQRTEVFTEEDGWLDIEQQYLPRVCTQENGKAAYLALEVQAIAARTYLLRHMRDDPSVGTPSKPVVNGESFQAYAASANPGCVQATNATKGVVGLFQSELIVANYVAGALVRNDGSKGKDPTHTEKFVTYNEGLSGDAVTPAPKPIALPDRSDNRGCMGQNRADFLASSGYSTEEILRHFYGADLELNRTPSARPGCGNIPTSGSCDDDVFTWCAEDVVETFDCARRGGRCVIQENGTAGCADPETPADCGAVSYEGVCEGDTLKWCSDYNRLRVSDCAAAGLTCSYNKRGSGGYECLPPVEGSCEEGTVEPQCAGTIFLRCSGGQLAYIDCDSVGMACAYVGESVGCYEIAN